ncbi:hypothetical protein ACS0TY_029432 [Phlomoides rotata]
MDAVKANLGGGKVKICGLIQYVNLFGVAIGYTIAASVNMLAIKRQIVSTRVTSRANVTCQAIDI